MPEKRKAPAPAGRCFSVPAKAENTCKNTVSSYADDGWDVK